MTSGEASRTLAHKINWLIEYLWPTGIAPATSNADVASVIQRVTKEYISRSTLWKLRTGRQPNPTLHTLKTLATFFQVPIGYFDDGEQSERIEEQLTLLALMRGGGVDDTTLRTFASLSPEGRHMISEIIASAARMEKYRTSRNGDAK